MAARHRVGVIGSGNFGSALAKVLGENTVHLPHFEDEVKMWVYEELIDGRKLTEIINERHENVKYLPGFKLPTNVRAVPDLAEAVEGCDYILICLPHQFCMSTIKQLPKLREGATMLSGIKGLSVVGEGENRGFELLTDTMEKTIHCPVGALMGGNIATDVAAEKFSETTIAFRDVRLGELWKAVVQRPYLRTSVIQDVVCQQLCGTLKNIVALAGGFVTGLNYGQSTMAAILRLGMWEMWQFADWAFPGAGVNILTLLESCGVGDTIATAYGGRHQRVAAEFVRTGKDFDTLEAEMLNGQKLQGFEVAMDVLGILKARGVVKKFPLFTTTAMIAQKKVPPETIIAYDGPHLDLAYGDPQPLRG